jgi:hypothetical protein
MATTIHFSTLLHHHCPMLRRKSTLSLSRQGYTAADKQGRQVRGKLGGERGMDERTDVWFIDTLPL